MGYIGSICLGTNLLASLATLSFTNDNVRPRYSRGLIAYISMKKNIHFYVAPVGLYF